MSWILLSSWTIFTNKNEQFFSLEAQRLDKLTGHTGRPRCSSGRLLPEPGLARTGFLQAQAGRNRTDPGPGRREQTSCPRIDRLSRAKMATQAPQEASQTPGRLPRSFFGKNYFFQKLLGGSVWASWGSPGGLGWPFWLSKLIDSRTRRLFPSSGARVELVSARLGLGTASCSGKSGFELHLGRRVWPMS